MYQITAMSISMPTMRINISAAAAKRPRRQQQKAKTAKPQTDRRRSSGGFALKEPTWRCVERCGACCKLDKESVFATPEEIFTNPSDVELYKSMMGPDGWCIHYDKASRKCSIYDERPYFCRVKPEVFESLYGIDKKKFNQEACNCCKDTIKALYGAGSEELENFNRAIRSPPPG